MRYFVTVGEQTLEVDVERTPEGSYRARLATGSETRINVQTHSPGLFDLEIDGHCVQVLPSDGEVRFRGEQYLVRTESALERAALATSGSSAAQSRKIVASMPGRIIHIACQVGQEVAIGSPLVVMEAMKMQNELSAKSAGVVRAIPIEVGQNVERGELLIELE